MDIESTTEDSRTKRKYPACLMRMAWFRKLVLPKKKSKGFPEFISKTDETRIQNMPFILKDKREWIATEKVDGQSGTFCLVRHKSKLPFIKDKFEYIVCSRNLRLYEKDNSSYWKVSDRYQIENALKNMIGDRDWIAIQGECIATNVQGNKYKVTEADLYVFNLLYPSGRMDSIMAKNICEQHGMKFVPILATDYVLPDTVNEVLDYAQHKKYDVSNSNELDKYSDKEQISEYALDSIKWANATGIITGTSDTTISPKDNVQRSQVAAILKRFCLNISNRKDNTVSDETETDVDNIDKTEKDVSSKTDGLKENDNNHKENTPVTNMESTSPEIIVDSIEAKPGDEIQIPVSIKNNPGILGMTLTLYYDENQCTLEKVENGAALNGILDFTTSKTLNSGARFVWDGVEISNDDVKDGEIIILTFKINENAHDGSCPITLKYFEDDIIDNNLSGIYPYIKNGEIKISD